jgi:hypothetical protein
MADNSLVPLVFNPGLLCSHSEVEFNSYLHVPGTGGFFDRKDILRSGPWIEPHFHTKRAQEIFLHKA